MKATFNGFFCFALICSLLFISSFPNLVRGDEFLQIEEGDQAPNFTLNDLNDHKFRLSDYKGRPVLLLFMTTWIRGTWKTIPRMKENYSLYNSKGLTIFNVDVMESREKVGRFAKERDIPYPTLLDEDGEVSRKFGIVGVPIFVLINGNGKIVCWDCTDLSSRLEQEFKLKKE